MENIKPLPLRISDKVLIVFPVPASFGPIHFILQHTAMFVCILETRIVSTVELRSVTEAFNEDVVECNTELLNILCDPIGPKL